MKKLLLFIKQRSKRIPVIFIVFAALSTTLFFVFMGIDMSLKFAAVNAVCGSFAILITLIFIWAFISLIVFILLTALFELPVAPENKLARLFFWQWDVLEKVLG